MLPGVDLLAEALDSLYLEPREMRIVYTMGSSTKQSL